MSSSRDVIHGNFLKHSQLPRLPKYTNGSFKFGDEPNKTSIVKLASGFSRFDLPFLSI